MSLPDRRAAALRDDGAGAPTVVAAGRGEIARRTIEEAKAAGAPIDDDVALADVLSRPEVEAQIRRSWSRRGGARLGGPRGPAPARGRSPSAGCWASRRPRPWRRRLIVLPLAAVAVLLLRRSPRRRHRPRRIRVGRGGGPLFSPPLVLVRLVGLARLLGCRRLGRGDRRRGAPAARRAPPAVRTA